MLAEMAGFFVSWFTNPSGWGIGLAVIFGAVWLAGYWPPLFKRHYLWAVLAGSAFLTLWAVTFIQIPLQLGAEQALSHFWSDEILIRWMLLTGIPAILLSGLVQEGAKLVPVVLCWWREGRNLDPKLGLAIGAVAGAGFGIFEAQWVHNTIFASGWSWEAAQTIGMVALAGFWERFFAVAFHIASCALAGWGLARGWGWQFYLIASGLHALINYSVLLLQSGLLSVTAMEILVAMIASLVAAAALWLRWRKPAQMAEAEVSPA
jgi:RsiW-degrading membrane proteinase PrsW (M82 family)